MGSEIRFSKLLPHLRLWLVALASLFAIYGAASAAPPTRTDLADTAAGVYRGDVISDARGASRSNVTITVAKVGPNRVRVTSSYPRLPAFEVQLTKAQTTIQQANGTNVFLLELSKRPNGLHVTVDDASWAGTRSAAAAQGSASAPAAARQDLADIAAGSYFGDVISDARGSSQSDVAINVVKVGPNQVEVSSDYSRLPTFRTRLTRAMNTIQKSGPGDEVFLLDLSKRPPGLDVTVDDASWSGAKR